MSSPNEPSRCAAAMRLSKSRLPFRRFPPRRRLITASPPASPATAAPPAISGIFTREAARETAFPASLVPAAAAFAASAALAAAPTGAAVRFATLFVPAVAREDFALVDALELPLVDAFELPLVDAFDP